MKGDKLLMFFGVVFVSASMVFFYESAKHDHSSHCRITGQSRDDGPYVSNSNPSKSDCVRQNVFYGCVVLALGVASVTKAVMGK